MFSVSPRYFVIPLALAACCGTTTVFAQISRPGDVEPVTELEQFIATETALSESGEVLPTSRPTASVFGEMSVLDAPRAVTVLTPELMAQFDIQNFGDLGRIGAGSNSIPGLPS